MHNIHIVRSPDGINHGVATTRSNIRANGRVHTICAIRVDNTFQVRPGGYPHTVMTCPIDIGFVTALADWDESVS